MKKILISFVLLMNVFVSSSQTTLGCVYMVGTNTSAVYLLGDTSKLSVTDNFIRVDAVSLGDAGESSDPKAYLSRFEKTTNYLSVNYSDTSLFELIKQNKCPLTSCYAFTALVSSDEPDKKIIEKVMSQFAEDTTSFVNLDWGCGNHRVSVFDYLLCLMSEHIYDDYLEQIKPFDQKMIEFFLEKRKKFYSGKDIYNRIKSWGEYKEYYVD